MTGRVPRPACSLPTSGSPPGSPGGEVTTLPPREEWLRLRTRLLFSRTQSANTLEVVLDFSPEDQLWAEWIAAVLANAEITVRWVDEVPADPG